MISITPLSVSAQRFFATFGCGSSVTRPATDVVTKTMNSAMTQFCDFRTETDKLPVCSASRLFVNRT